MNRRIENLSRQQLNQSNWSYEKSDKNYTQSQKLKTVISKQEMENFSLKSDVHSQQAKKLNSNLRQKVGQKKQIVLKPESRNLNMVHFSKTEN